MADVEFSVENHVAHVRLNRPQGMNAITGGMDALGEVSVTVAEDGRKVIGHGAHPDIIVASAKAYVHALNKLEWHKARHASGEPKGI